MSTPQLPITYDLLGHWLDRDNNDYGSDGEYMEESLRSNLADTLGTNPHLDRVPHDFGSRCRCGAFMRGVLVLRGDHWALELKMGACPMVKNELARRG